MPITEILNNREIAVAIWLLIVSIWMLTKRSVRSSILGVFKAMSDKKIIIPIIFMFIYVLVMVIILKRVGYWDYTALKDTIYWFAGTAFVMFVNINKAASEEDYFKNTIIDQIKFVVVLEFVVNLYSFSLPVELIVMPFIALVALTSGYASINPEHKKVKSLLDFILGVFGIILIVFTVKEIVSDFQGILSLKNFRDFSLPVLFTLVFLPFIYILALLIQYESIFIRIKIFNKDQRLVKYTIWKIFLVCKLSLRKLNKFARSVGLIKVNSKEDVEVLLNKFRP